MTPRLFLFVFTMEVRKMMAYRANFWIGSLASFLVNISVLYFVWEAVFRESGKHIIGGYDFQGIVAYYVLVLLLGRLVRGMEYGSVANISDEIYQGTLSRYLVYPTNYFLFKYAGHLGLLVPAVIQLAVVGGLSTTLLDLGGILSLTPARAAMAVAAVLLGNLLNFLMLWPIHAVAFWQDNVWSLEVMLRFTVSILGGFMLPLSVFPAWSHATLSLLPFRYLFGFPADLLMGRVSNAEWAQGMVVCCIWCAVFGVLSRVVWRRGCIQYTGVGI